jgi:agmatine deiminase
LEVIKLHQPEPLFMSEDEARGVDAVEGTEPRVAGTRLAGSYVNFYVCNGAVILPLLDHKHDGQAIETLSRAFPERKIKGVEAREILLGGGNIHCILQQQPAGHLA